ncbi:MAG TPA: assimilatory sulfite reductase (NADPH) flavoprotein subunit, partial [Rhodanobacter sp.]
MNAALKSPLPGPTLGADRLAQLASLTSGLSSADLYWIAAYSAALAARLPERAGRVVASEPAAEVGQATGRLSIV